ncbi:hypothetical protein GCM10011585_25780 [Edaphobacter dinghuensis]|uniref:Uncharacterized protein n=1 Tax=Edaphobacter dinghuensis TaxID=1560005 RepID=A0A917M6V2_9BACT|nr:hypothetical protein GCM10011585_25780 [Edaphobacter dinghuensis]
MGLGWLRGLGEGHEAAEAEQDGGGELLPGRSQWIELIVIGWDDGRG